MRFHYLLYPNALEKIKKSGIEKRVEDLKKSKEGLPFIGGHVSAADIAEIVKDMKERGYYGHIPAEFVQKYKTAMNGIIQKPEDFFWTVKRLSDTVKEPCDLEDMIFFSGDIASMVLKPAELWDYKKFGFSSPSEFVTTVGAFIQQKSRILDTYREGYTWTTKRDDGSEIKTKVTGDNNADMRIYQTDIAPYPTEDPFGNPIEMRPETSADSHVVAAYHSTEAILMVAAMKYIEQQGIAAEYIKDNAKSLIEWGKSFGQSGGSCTEHFGGFDHDARSFFIAYEYSIPGLHEDKPTNFWLNTVSDGAYGAFIEDGALILSYQTRDSESKPISARFLPEDAEQLIKGLIYQSAQGLGRTSAKQLLGILAYRYSPEFEIDQKR
jgi:hypothetical protein